MEHDQQEFKTIFGTIRTFDGNVNITSGTYCTIDGITILMHCQNIPINNWTAILDGDLHNFLFSENNN
jgi:hypothetical protein